MENINLEALINAFENLSATINNKIHSFVKSINDIQSKLNSEAINTGNIENLNFNEINEKISQYVNNIRETMNKLNTVVSSLAGFHTLDIEPINTNDINIVDDIAKKQKEKIEKIIEAEKKIDEKINKETDFIPPDIEQTPPQSEKPKYNDEEYPYKYYQPESHLTTIGLPYQNITKNLSEYFLNGIDSIKEKLSETGNLSFATLSGGLNENTFNEIISKLTSPEKFSLAETLNNFGNYLYKTGSILDELVNISFAKQTITQQKENISESTYNTLLESISSTQQNLLAKSSAHISQFISQMSHELGYFTQIQTTGNLPLNVGSPDFYAGIFGHQVTQTVPANTMGVILSDTIESIQTLDKVLNRSLFSPMSFERETTQYLKGTGISFFQSDIFNNVIQSLKNINPERYNQIQPYIEQIQQVSSLERLNQLMTNMREIFTGYATSNLTEVNREELQSDLKKINLSELNNLFKELDKVGGLDNEAKSSIEKIRNFLTNLKSFSEGANVDFESLNVTSFVENIKKLSNSIETNINDFFKKDFSQVIENIYRVTPEIKKSPLIEPQQTQQFESILGAFRNVNTRIRQSQGELGFFERIGYGMRASFGAPLKEMLELNIQNFQWALMLGLSSSVMDIMTRPAYETVYSTVSPIYQTIGAATGLTSVFNVFQQFPQQLTQMTSLLQTSLNSISALLGSNFYSQQAVRTATEIARVQPIQLPEALELLTAISTYPTTRPYAQNEQFQSRMFQITQLLSLLAPEQGVRGALFAIREALGGQWRSMQLRFNISPEVLAQYAGIPETKFRSSTGKELIDNLYTALTRMFGGEQVLLQKGAQFDIQLGNILDTLITNITLPLISQQNNQMTLLIDRWLNSGLMQRFMPQQYEMLTKIARERAGAGATEEEIKIQQRALAQQTWGTTTGGLSGIIAMFNTALGDVFSGLNITQALSNIVGDFGNRFTNTLEQYSERLEKLSTFSPKYEEKRRNINEDFINQLFEDIAISIRQVTGTNLNIGTIMNTVREAIVGQASQMTSFILKESLSTAVELPGTMFGIFSKSALQGFSTLYERGNLQPLLDATASLGTVVSGFASWINLIKIKEQSQRTGSIWAGISSGGVGMLTAAASSYFFQQNDIISQMMGFPMLALTMFPHLLPEGRFGKGLLSGAILSTAILNSMRQATHGMTSHLISAIETGLSTFALTNFLGPQFSIPLGLLGAAIGGGISFFNERRSREIESSSINDFLNRQITSIDSLMSQVAKNFHTTFSSVLDKSYLTQNREGITAIENYLGRIAQIPHALALESTKGFSILLQELNVPNKRQDELTRTMFNTFETTFSNIVEKIKGGETVSADKLKESLTTAIKSGIGLTAYKENESAISTFINQLTQELLPQLQTTRQMSNISTQALQLLEPAMITKVLNDMFYRKPVQIEEIQKPEDIQKYVTNVQRAIGDMVTSYKAIPNMLNTTFGLLTQGNIPFDAYKSISTEAIKPFIDMIKENREGSAKAIGISPLFDIFIKLNSLIMSGMMPSNVSKQWRELVTPQFTENVINERMKSLLEKISIGQELIGKSKEIPLTSDIINQIQQHTLQPVPVSDVSSKIIQAGNSIAEALTNVSTTIKTIVDKFNIDLKIEPSKTTNENILENIPEPLSTLPPLSKNENETFKPIETFDLASLVKLPIIEPQEIKKTTDKIIPDIKELPEVNLKLPQPQIAPQTDIYEKPKEITLTVGSLYVTTGTVNIG